MTRREPLSDEQRDTMLQCLMSEHAALQAARGSTVFDANGRVAVFLSTTSSVLVALAFIGQVSELGVPFFLFALVLFPPLFFIGLVTFSRTLQSGTEDMLYARSINRIRHFYVETVPQARPYFVSISDDIQGSLRSMGVRSSHWQLLLTTASLVATINSVIAGVFAGLSLNRLVPSLLISCLGGIVVFVVSIVIHQHAQREAWRQFEAQTPTLFPNQESPSS